MYRFFSDDVTDDAVELLAGAHSLTVFVGAGASAEVGFPTWSQLLNRLSEQLVDELDDEESSELMAFISDAGALTAAERIQRSLPEPDMAAVIRAAIYRQDKPEAFQPGPLTWAVARLKSEFVDATRVITTNYDQLLLTAVRDLGLDGSHSYCQPTEKPQAIVHLHGVIGYEDPDDGRNEVILTEHDFYAPSAGWRWDLVKRALNEDSCLFVGASLTDLNLLLPLHQVDAGEEPRHVVVFVRDPRMTESVRRRAEQIDRARWEALGVRVLFADNYGDVGQFVDEVRLRKKFAGGCISLPDRIASWQSDSMTVLCPADRDSFVRSQEVLVDQLERLLTTIQVEFDLQDEVMQLGVFALGFDGAGPTEFASVVATSDRIMRDPRSGERLDLNRSTPWTGVRAMITGTPVSESKDHYASRWKYMLGIPVRLGSPLDCCVGAVVLSSTSRESGIRSQGEGTLTPAKYRRLCDLLAEAGEIVLSGPTAHQPGNPVTPPE